MFNKSLFKSFLLLAILATVFTSCSKDDITKKDNAVKKSTDEIRNAVPGATDPTYLLDVSADEWCTTKGTNCTSTLSDTPSGSAYLAAFEIAISTGSVGVTDYFNGNDYLYLFPSLESDPYQMLTRLQSGKYEIQKLIDPKNSNHIIYKASNIDGDSFGLQLNIKK